jgi:hypothetical protein
MLFLAIRNACVHWRRPVIMGRIGLNKDQAELVRSAPRLTISIGERYLRTERQPSGADAALVRRADRRPGRRRLPPRRVCRLRA